MVVNFRTREISRSAYMLAQTSTLIYIYIYIYIYISDLDTKLEQVNGTHPKPGRVPDC
jgi:hypothetical protein